MNAAEIAEGLRLIASANARWRTATLIDWREKGYRHPLARAHREVSHRESNAGVALVRSGLTEGTALYRLDDPRTPEDWRREGERAARCFELGVAFAEALERQALARRITADEQGAIFAEADRLQAAGDPRVVQLEVVAP